MQSQLVTATLLLSSALLAQNVILPSAVATTRPTSSTFYTGNVFYSTTSTTTAHDSHTQMIYDVLDIAPVTASCTAGVRP